MTSSENDLPIDAAYVAPDDLDEFAGEVKVASSIVDHLSSGLYESPASCLKELINNAYDADATEVQVFVKPDADRIIVADNGHGFTREQFEDHFDRVSDSAKRDSGDTTPSLERPLIGHIGIGFIAANEICEELEIFSTMAGSTDLLHVVIDFRAMRQPRDTRTSGDDTVKKGDYRGRLEEAGADEHYTQLFLKEIKGEAREMLVAPTAARGIEGDAPSLFGLNADTIAERLKSTRLEAWSDFDFYSQTMLEVGMNVPVRYAPGWVPERHHDLVEDFERDVADLRFKVEYDGTDLRKSIVLPDAGEGRTLLRRVELQGDHVSATGYFYARYTVLKPLELNGVLLRIRNAAVGGYDHTFLGFPRTINTLFQRWISCELYVDDRLEPAMNIDRRTLRAAHPAFAELQTLFHAELKDFLSLARSELHSKPTGKKQAVRAREQVEHITSAVQRSAAGEAPGAGRKEAEDAAKSVEREIEEMLASPADVRRLLRKWSVAEIYDVVLEVARETLPPAERSAFLRALTRKMMRRR